MTSLERLRVIAVLAACLVGCGPSTGGTDAGPPPELEPLAAYNEGTDEFTPTALDYSCIQPPARTRPAGGAPVETTFQLRDFQEGFPVSDTDVWLFTNDVIADDCAAPDCTMFTTDRMGNASVMLPAGGWYAYRVLPKMGLTAMTTVYGVFQYNEPAPTEAGQSVTGNSVSGVTIDLIPSVLGVSRLEGSATVAGRISDCAGGYVQNAIVRMYDPDGNEIVGSEQSEQPHFNYFNGTVTNDLPNQLQEASNKDGLYVVIQVPYIDDRPYRVEAWGNLGGTFTKLSCETARIFPDAVTILNLDPLRSDGSADCGG